MTSPPQDRAAVEHRPAPAVPPGASVPPLRAGAPGTQTPAAGENAAAELGKVTSPRPAGGTSDTEAREAQRDAWKAAETAKSARQARNRPRAKAQAPRAGMVRYRPRGGRG